jgi:hypothetical protein
MVDVRFWITHVEAEARHRLPPLLFQIGASAPFIRNNVSNEEKNNSAGTKSRGGLASYESPDVRGSGSGRHVDLVAPDGLHESDAALFDQGLVESGPAAILPDDQVVRF